MTTQLHPSSVRPAHSHSTPPMLAAATAILLVFAAACSSGTPSPTPGPTGTISPTSTPAPVGIQHPTGARDVVLRMETGGGFVPMDFLATSAPSFTLYGDGTVVFKDPTVPGPDPAGNITRLAPFMTVRLDEDGIQALLTDALGRGGLGVAMGPYMGQGADLPTTTFTITADGRTRQVSVTPLSPDMHPQNAAIVTALAGLAERLNGFGGVVAGEQVYQPAAYRGILMSIDQAFGPVIAWPWSDVSPADFVAGENTFLLLRTMTPAEVAALAIPSIEGGVQGLNVQKGDKLYSLGLRPLLPDETR